VIEILKADARRIKEASINNKLVVFVGAGVSMNQICLVGVT
jgi:NAD-dependent SIR2 family protein deacetylase